MKQIYTKPISFYNKKRSFCYFYFNNKRIKIYNGKCLNKNIYPNKEKGKKETINSLNKLRSLLGDELKNNWIPESTKITYEQEFKTNLKTLKKIDYEGSIFKERINIKFFEHQRLGSIEVAKEIAKTIKKTQFLNKNCVLGLATGSSPIDTYSNLVRMHKEEGLSFKNVITFNLDEYLEMNPNSIHSYHYFMHEHLFNHIDIKKENIHIPKGNIRESEIQKHCIQYEKKIEKAGGIDLQLLGIGRNGHIGFNEPGSLESSITRKVTIENKTRVDASPEFGGIENVPKQAISMGINTILNAKKIILIAWGENKRKVIKKAVEEQINDLIPASFLQNHNNTKFVLDSESAADLNRFTCPWLYTDVGNYLSKILSSGQVGWDKKSIKKAVIWLSIKKNKPILLLTDEDYNENGMSEIFDKYKSAYLTNILVFNMLQHTITGWPGGKPNADDSQRPERTSPKKKRVIIFSPHPDDDVISMGGTFDRLIQQGHDVHIAYQTSGNIAVKDSDVLEITEFIKRLVNNLSKDDFNKLTNQNIINDSHVNMGINFHNAIKNLFKKKINLEEYKALNKIKGLIRQSEAFQGCKQLGLSDENKIHFLDLPFYQTGRIKKKDISTQDIHIVKNLIETVKPHQIYAAGDLNDPHGTHRLCLRAIYRSIDILKSKSFMKRCNVWLYRGAWKEWKTYDIDMAVPLSPDQILKKRRAIFKHKSQKDTVAYPGDDLREFWQRAEDRNKKTAEFYSNLGFAKYAAMEAFKRYRF